MKSTLLFIAPFILKLFFGMLIFMINSSILGQSITAPVNQYYPLIGTDFTLLNVNSSVIVTPDFVDINNIIDNDLSTTASRSFNNTTLNSVWLEVENENNGGNEFFPGGTYAGFVVNEAVLQLGVINAVTLSTYLNGTATGESASGVSLAKIDLGSTARIGFITTKDFDEVKLTVENLAGVGNELQVFEAFVAANDALPVNYGPISAIMKNSILKVNWTTLFETNNKEFVIEGSIDGKNWMNIGTMVSKAKNGNSDKPIEYNFEKMFESIAMAGFSLASVFALAIIFLAIFPITKRKKMFSMLGLMILSIGITIISCKKTDVHVDMYREMIKFIRIGQIDADNTVHYSNAEKIIYK